MEYCKNKAGFEYNNIIDTFIMISEKTTEDGSSKLRSISEEGLIDTGNSDNVHSYTLSTPTRQISWFYQ